MHPMAVPTVTGTDPTTAPDPQANLAAYLRSFRYLHLRSLLDLQAHIESLERELDDIDQLDFDNVQHKRLKSRASDLRSLVEDGTQRPRSEVITELGDKLHEYNELLIKTREVEAFQRPSARDYRSVRAWFYNERPLVSRESEFIQQPDIALPHPYEDNLDSILVYSEPWGQPLIPSPRWYHTRAFHRRVQRNKKPALSTIAVLGLPLTAAILSKVTIINGARITSGALSTGAGVALVPLQTDGRADHSLLIA